MAIKIVLADDHQLFREGLHSLLERESDIEVVGEAENGKQVLELVQKKRPDLVVMDISMPDMNGIEASKKISEEFPGTRILALSMHSDKRYVANMLQSGASGFLLKDCASDELMLAIHQIMNNKTYLSPSIVDVVFQDYVSQLKGTSNTVFEQLTEREREVLQLLVEGKSNKEIAESLFISVKTVETHRQNIMNKLNIHNLPDLTKFAIREGFTSLE